MAVIRALLLTDVVDSTKLAATLGDTASASLWAAHDCVARDLLRDSGGREIDKSDGMLLLFDSASDAVRYAFAYHSALGALDVPVKARAALHVGPVVLRENSPADVALGYHFCFGTLGGWPRFQPDDLSEAVNLANAFVAASGRRVDWIYLPVLDSSDDAFFRPLAGLEPNGARVYLGAIHNMERFEERVTTARKFLPRFGLGAYCADALALPLAPPWMERLLAFDPRRVVFAHDAAVWEP